LNEALAIGGYTEPKGTRTALGALLLGVHEDGELCHPRFLGLRRDKPARQVVRERPRA
jgi:hypothetical protein